ncbi:MAG: family 16 glycosylhydrolase [Oceanipulchritudo sp.]
MMKRQAETGLRLRGLAGCGLGMAGTLLTGQPDLIWSDEFEEPGLPDNSKWLYDVGGGGWGNDEEQFYTEGRLENARVEDGVLIIEARREGWPPSRNPSNDYTSARLLSKGTGDWLYGRIEVRAKLPSGRGTWPAIWMLPTGNAYGSWPRSGEIDIMEHVGFDPGVVHGSLHSLAHNWTTGTQPTDSISVPEAETAFHTYAVEWTPSAIRFYVDEDLYLDAPNPGTDWEEWPFDQPFHLILNLAVGGFWGGQEGIDPDVWPARMEIDHVRVYDLGDTVPLDTDGDGIPNETDPDDDGDGLTDVEEHVLGTNILVADTDGDGFSDFEEVEAGSNPLLSVSYPGSDAGQLITNPDFQLGEDPWIIHTNKLDASGDWVGQSGSWGGAYAVFDYVTLEEDAFVFSNYAVGDSARAEHLLYQELSPSSVDLLPGDVVRFRGTGEASASVEGIATQAFIRILDFSFQPLPASVVADIGPEAGPFSLEAVIPEESFNVLQTGVAITAPQSASATITLSGIESTLNESPSWGGWPVTDGYVNTDSWLGWLYIPNDPWVQSLSLDKWIYAPESSVTPGGGWIYIPR